MPYRKQVLCTETGIIYISVACAGKLTNVLARNIACACRGEQATSGDFHWRYFTDGDWIKYRNRIQFIDKYTWKIDFTEDEMQYFVGRNGTVYMYTNKINGKRYIGQTWHPDVRFKQHIKQAYTGGRDCYVFHHALKKYGIEGFEYTRLYEHIETAEELDRLEKETIEQCDSIVPKGYNIKGGGAGGGAVRYEGVLEKMRNRGLQPIYCIDLQKEFKSNRYAKEALGLDIKSTISCPYRMKKIGWWYYKGHYWQYAREDNNYLSLEYVVKEREKYRRDAFDRRGYAPSKDGRPSMRKKVICIETQKIYKSVTEAAEDVHGNVTNITYVCRKKSGKKAMNTYLGYHWDYYEEGKIYDVDDYIPAGHICPVICLETGKIYNNMRYAAKFVDPFANVDELRRISVCIYHSIESRCAGAGYHWDYYKKGIPVASLDEYKSARSKNIICVETGKVYKTAVDVQNELGCAATNIIRCCKGRARSVYGLHWKYEEGV